MPSKTGATSSTRCSTTRSGESRAIGESQSVSDESQNASGGIQTASALIQTASDETPSAKSVLTPTSNRAWSPSDESDVQNQSDQNSSEIYQSPSESAYVPSRE